MITRQYSSDMQFTEEIRRKADIAEVISRRLSLTKAGRGWMSACPFHLDKAMTFHVFTDSQNWRCFGDCATGGNAIHFVMRFESLTFGEATDRLALQFGIARTGPSGDRLDGSTRDHGQVSLADDQAGGRASQFLDMTTFSDVLRKRTAEKQVANNREAPIDQEAYMALTRFQIRQLESRLCRDESPARLEREALRSSLPGLHRRDRPPVVDNLAYPRGFGRLDSPRVNRDQQPGLVVASFLNLQPHLKIEYPDGLTALVDTAAYADGGEVIWTEQGSGTVKSLDTGEHYSEEVEIKGITTKGFCLLRPPGRRDYTWMAPREPEELGGRNRPTYLPDGSSFRVFALESFNIDAAILTDFEDISGLAVKLQEPERSPRRHRDHLGLGH